jgi:hypothetical protein
MRQREIHLRYNPQLGEWYNPLTWFGKESSPAPVVTAEQPQTEDSFFAPGQEQVMQEQLAREKLESEYRKKMLLLAGVAGILLLIAIFAKRQSPKLAAREERI